MQRSRRAEAKSSALGFPQSITETADGFNRVTRLAQFLTQPAHVRIHCAGVNHAFVTPNLVKKPIAFLHRYGCLLLWLAFLGLALAGAVLERW